MNKLISRDLYFTERIYNILPTQVFKILILNQYNFECCKKINDWTYADKDIPHGLFFIINNKFEMRDAGFPALSGFNNNITTDELLTMKQNYLFEAEKNMNCIIVNTSHDITLFETTKKINTGDEMLRCYGFDVWLIYWITNFENTKLITTLQAFAVMYETKEIYDKMVNIVDTRIRSYDFIQFMDS